MIQSKQSNTLFDLIYELPLTKQEIKNYQELQNRIQQIIVALINQAKISTQEIEKVCKTNAKLNLMARLLREHNPPEGVKQVPFSVLISSIISMFTYMMTPKMIEHFNKLNIPFSIYRIVLRIYCYSGKLQYLKKMEIEQCFKFIVKLLSVKSKNFPRLYCSLIINLLNQYSQKNFEKQKKQQQNQSQDIIVNKENERMAESIKNIFTIALQLTKNNLKLSAESGILVAMYRKAIQNDLTSSFTSQFIETIANHMNTRDSRQIILNHLDLCKVFALFTNVDSRLKDGKSDQKIERCAVIIEMLLSHCSTLFYFLSEKVTLKNFVISLKSKSKSEKQLSIINQKIFMKLIDKAMRYDRNKMQRSYNLFGLHSNYLNYRALLILSFFLDSTQIFQIYLNSNPNGQLFGALGKISLMYFPITFEKGKYNKQIIQTIKLPAANAYEKLSRDFLNILSYYDYSIIPYEFAKTQLINYLLEIKKMDRFNKFPQQNKLQVQDLLNRAKQSHSQNFDDLLLNFYISVMKICEILEWKPEHLKLCKFLSVIIQYLCSRDYVSICNACIEIVSRIFDAPKPNYYKYLYITALDDAGKYFQDHEKIKQIILSHYRNNQFSFRISRILLHADIIRNDLQSSKTTKQILTTICIDGGSEQLILQTMEIIRFYCLESDQKSEWGAKIICQKLLYHSNQQIACAAVQFCQQFAINHKTYKDFIYAANLPQIKNMNLRKRIMYLLLNCDSGLQILSTYNPNFVKDQLELWLKQGHNQIKQLSIFLSKQSKKFTGNKENSFLQVGNINQNRRKLIYLPWNVSINGKYYVGLASYKYLKQKIKLRFTTQLLVQNKIQLSTFIQVGVFKLPAGQSKFGTIVKRQEIMKNYEKNKIKDNKQLKQFAVSKQKITFTFKYNAGCLVLQKILIDIPLARDIYRSLSYPLNFITQLTKTAKGRSYLTQHKFIHQCLQFCKHKEDKDDKDLDVQLIKGSIQCLGMLFSCRKQIPLLEKLETYSVVFEIVDKANNLQIKQAALWVLNMLVKDDDLRRKLNSMKGWLILQSKYCGWLCYPQFYNQSEYVERQINQFQHIKTLLVDRKVKEDVSSNLGYNLIHAVLEVSDKNDKEIFNQKSKRKQMIQFFKKPENKALAWDSKLLQKVVMYVSTINFGIQRTREVLDMFTDYFLSEKFDTDFAYGSSLP